MCVCAEEDAMQWVEAIQDLCRNCPAMKPIHRTCRQKIILQSQNMFRMASQLSRVGNKFISTVYNTDASLMNFMFFS